MKVESSFQITVDLAELQLFKRLRQLRRLGQNDILLIQTADLRELGRLPAEQPPVKTKN